MFIEMWVLWIAFIFTASAIACVVLFLSETNHDNEALRRILKSTAHQRNDYEARALKAEQTLADIRAFDRMIDTIYKD